MDNATHRVGSFDLLFRLINGVELRDLEELWICDQWLKRSLKDSSTCCTSSSLGNTAAFGLLSRGLSYDKEQTRWNGILYAVMLIVQCILYLIRLLHCSYIESDK